MEPIENISSASGKTIRCIVVYAFAHFVLDAACYFALLGIIDSGKELTRIIILYNIIAFGFQPFLGMFSDILGKPVLFAFLGCIITCLAFFFPVYPVIAAICAGCGNALFHVGGGTVSLNLRQGKAIMPGLFVAPGGLGLFAGSLLVKYHFYHPVLPVVILIIMGMLLLLIKQPVNQVHNRRIVPGKYLFISVILLLLTINIRAGVGFALRYPWSSNGVTAAVFIFAMALGKGLGGYLSDRFGWIKITVGGLTVSSFLLFSGSHYIFTGVAGILLFNMSMPVTLTAISNLLYGRPGFSFGLTAIALLAGSLPALFGKEYFNANDIQIGILVLLSAASLLGGLLLYRRLMRTRQIR